MCRAFLFLFVCANFHLFICCVVLCGAEFFLIICCAVFATFFIAFIVPSFYLLLFVSRLTCLPFWCSSLLGVAESEFRP